MRALTRRSLAADGLQFVAVVLAAGDGQAAFSAASWAAVSAFSWAASSLEWPPQGWPPGPPWWAVPLFSAASWAALSPASCAVASFELGVGDAAARAAKAGVRVPRANAVAPRTPPKIIAAATTDAKTRTRVLSIR